MGQSALSATDTEILLKGLTWWETRIARTVVGGGGIMMRRNVLFAMDMGMPTLESLLAESVVSFIIGFL